LEEDAEELEDRLKENSQLPESSRRPVTAIKQESIERILKEQPYRRAHRAEILQSKRLLATATIMDLTSLGAEARTSFLDKSYILIRDEYKKMIDIVKSEYPGGDGSVFLSGQPGIGELRRFFFFMQLLTLFTGKRHMLFFLLVERLRAGKTTYFQTKQSLILFEAGQPVRKVAYVGHIPGEDIWALVDGEVYGGQPHPGMIQARNVRIVMVSSPKPWCDISWLNQKNNPAGTFYMRTWTEEELLLAGCVLLVPLVKRPL
jgi:hypothetical protein